MCGILEALFLQLVCIGFRRCFSKPGLLGGVFFFLPFFRIKKIMKKFNFVKLFSASTELFMFFLLSSVGEMIYVDILMFARPSVPEINIM